MSRPILYISYDGMLEPLGQSQVLAYLEKLALDRPIDLISFEKAADWRDVERRKAIFERCRIAGIAWHPLRYHKRFSVAATAADIAIGIAKALSLVRRNKPALIHARSYVAAIIARAVKRLTGTPFLFDMRGFWPDERVDGGIWKRDGRIYRAAKQVERSLLRLADHVVTLTEASVPVIRSLDAFADRTAPPITVIPTCADLQRFSPGPEAASSPFVVGHVGTVGTWYLLDEMVRTFAEIRRQRADARWIIANRGEHEQIHAAVARHGIDPDAVEIVALDPSEMAAFIRRMSVGMAIIKPVYSKIASAPTKLAEYLGCGVPCLGNAGVGDIERIIEGKRVGIAIADFSDRSIRSAVERLLALIDDSGLRARCRLVAEQEFSLDEGVRRYRAIYHSLGADARRL